MKDAEMIQRCADAIGLDNTGLQRLEAGIGGVRFNPLSDNGDAMTLVKRLGIELCHWEAELGLDKGTRYWNAECEKFNACSSDLNRAIVECVATMHKAKGGIWPPR